MEQRTVAPREHPCMRLGTTGTCWGSCPCVPNVQAVLHEVDGIQNASSSDSSQAWRRPSSAAPSALGVKR